MIHLSMNLLTTQNLDTALLVRLVLILMAKYVFTIVLDGVILTILTVTFSVLSFCYIRNKTIKNEEIQKEACLISGIYVV